MRPPWKVVSVSLRYVRDFSFCFIYRVDKIKLDRWFTKWTSVIIGLSKMSDGENDSIM